MNEEPISALQPGRDAESAPANLTGMGNIAETSAPQIPDVLSILPLRSFVVFPGTILPLTVGRAASIKLLDETLPQTKIIGLLTQRDETKEDPQPGDLYPVGTAAIVLKLLRQSDNHVVIVVQGLRRFALRKIVATDPYLRAEVDLLNSKLPPKTKEWEATFRNLRDSAAKLLELTPDMPEQARAAVLSIEDPEQLADFLAPNLNVETAKKQAILEELDVEKRLAAVQTSISAQLEIAQIQQKLQQDVQSQFSEAQRRAYLREQMKAIQRELGEETGATDQIERLRKRLQEAKPPEEVLAQADRELRRLDVIPPASPEYSVIVSYVETIAELPWSEIRGHRRTYIASMPGRIIQELRRAGTRNPVMMLDEIDKIGADFRGDPASALLEVLDPRQNNTFSDRYLDVPFDLSQVLFIATANYIDGVPEPLRDRMEVISLPGYTEREKLEIAKRYLVRRQLEENGLKPEQCEFQDDAFRLIINDYTHEAGVRELETQIGAVCRAVAAQVARGERDRVTIAPERVAELLGPAKYVRETKLKTSQPGVVTGLAYTPAGGEVLHIEAMRYPGKGNVTLTGHIGEVMKESVQAALSLVRSRDGQLGANPEDFRKIDIHVHVPAGAVPKDGPSAGIAMFTALASLFSNTPVRSDIAMTGEITLRGLVLPIGGLKEKTLAAMRAGISTVIIPKLNEKDLVDVPEEAKQKLKFVPVENVDEVLAVALETNGTAPALGSKTM